MKDKITKRLQELDTEINNAIGTVNKLIGKKEELALFLSTMDEAEVETTV